MSHSGTCFFSRVPKILAHFFGALNFLVEFSGQHIAFFQIRPLFVLGNPWKMVKDIIGSCKSIYKGIYMVYGKSGAFFAWVRFRGVSRAKFWLSPFFALFSRISAFFERILTHFSAF